MPVIYRDADANLGLLTDKEIAVLGYGNLGRPMALNLRDSAFPVLIGNPPDDYKTLAYRDGFEVVDIPEAARRANFLLVMIPDEVAPQVYLTEVAPHLQPGDTLVFASGYNITFGFIEPPPFVDVVLVAPQTVGEGVREGYVAGLGFPASWPSRRTHPARHGRASWLVAKALGALHRGAIELTFQQETELDLFVQQALLPAIFGVLQTAIDVLNREGFPEAIFTSLYLSGELGYIISKWAETGILPSLALHSLTQQYGMLSRVERFRRSSSPGRWR